MSAEKTSAYTISPTPENRHHTLVGATPLPDHVLRPTKDANHRLVDPQPVIGIHTPDFKLIPQVDPIEVKNNTVDLSKGQKELANFELKDERRFVEGIHYPDFDLKKRKVEKVRKGVPQIQAEDYDLTIDRADDNDDFDLIMTPKDHAAEIAQMRRILAEAKSARTQKLDQAIRVQKAQEKKQKLGPKPEAGHRGMRIPPDAQEIAARKGARVTSSDEAYRRQFQRRVNAARTQETLQADVTNAAINGMVATTEAVKSAVDRFRRRRNATSTTTPPTPPIVPAPPSAPTAPVTPPAPVRPITAPITPPNPNAIPNPLPEKKGLRDKVNELLHPPEKLLTEPVRIDINLAQAGENKPLEKLLKEAGTPPDETESWIRDEIYNTSPQNMIDSLGLKDMLKVDDISKLPVTTPPEVDPAKIDFILDAYHLKKVLDSKLLVKGEVTVKELLEKKYKKSFDAYQKLGAILQKDNLIEVFTQRVAQMSEDARQATPIDAMTMLPPSFMEGRYRLVILNDIFDQLQVKNPPVLPPGTSREEVLAALSVGETYKRVADQLYAEAKVEFELIEQDKEDRKVMPTLYGENINRADQELLKREYGRLLQIRKQYYDSLNATAVDYKLKESLENKYREQQGKMIHLWLEKGSSNIQSSLNKIVGALYPTADGSIRWRSWNRKNTHATPHWELVTILDDLDNDRGAIDPTTHKSEYEEALRLYQEAKKFTEYISDGMVLDPIVDISDKTIAQLKRNYGEIFFFHNVGTPVFDTEIDNYKPIHVDRVGIYPKANTSRNIKYFFNSQAAQIYCEALPQPAPRVESPPDPSAEPPPETPAPPGPPIYGENVEASMQAEFNKEFAMLLARREAFYNAVRANGEETTVVTLQQEYQTQQSKVLNMWYENGKDEITKTLQELEASMPANERLSKGMIERMDREKNLAPHVFMSKILTELQQYGYSENDTLREKMRLLYSNARELILLVSDGVVLDNNETIAQLSIEELVKKYGVIHARDNKNNTIPFDKQSTYKASNVKKVGIYRNQSLDHAIRSRIPEQYATVIFTPEAKKIENDPTIIIEETVNSITRKNIMAKLPAGSHIQDATVRLDPGKFENHGPDTFKDTEFSKAIAQLFNVVYTDIPRNPERFKDLLQKQLLTVEPSAQNVDNRIVRLHFFADHSNSDNRTSRNRFSEAHIEMELPNTQLETLLGEIRENPDVVEQLYQRLYPGLDAAENHPGIQRLKVNGIYYIDTGRLAEIQRNIIRNSGKKEQGVLDLFDTLKKEEDYREFRNGPYGQVDPSAPRVEAPQTETKIPLNEIYAQLGGPDGQKKAALEQLVAKGEVTEDDVRLVHEKMAQVEEASSYGASDINSTDVDIRTKAQNYRKLYLAMRSEYASMDDQERRLLASQLLELAIAKTVDFSPDSILLSDEMKHYLQLLQTLKINIRS